MAKYATYTSQEKTNIVSPNSPAAAAKENEAKMHQTFGNMLMTETNKVMDHIATEKGQKEAAEQGLNWKPANNLFEAGRAYNQAGQTIARTLGNVQMSNTFMSMYNDVTNQPLTTGDKNGQGGSVNNFVSQVDAYAKQTAIGKSTEEQALIKENAEHAKALYVPTG